MGCLYGWFGTIAVICFVLQLVRKVFPWIYENFIGPQLQGNDLKLKKYGKWAVVTGASDGIGKAYAQQLAKNGLNVVLVSRTLSKLEAVAKEIESEYKVETRVIDVDFKGGKDIYVKIENNIQDLEVGILVNNVGISYDSPEYFLSIPNRDQILIDLIDCNIHSVLNMTKMILPQMVERGTGAIINISSLSALTPTPLITVYAATKAFVHKFSDDLDTEYNKNGIIVQSVLPGPVATNMTKMKKSSWMAPFPNVYAEAALRKLGIAKQTTGYYPHALLKMGSDTVEFFSHSFVRSTAVKIMKNIAKRQQAKRVKSTSTASKDN